MRKQRVLENDAAREHCVKKNYNNYCSHYISRCVVAALDEKQQRPTKSHARTQRGSNERVEHGE
jgi:hypothetical protein